MRNALEELAFSSSSVVKLLRCDHLAVVAYGLRPQRGQLPLFAAPCTPHTPSSYATDFVPWPSQREDAANNALQLTQACLKPLLKFAVT